MFANSYSPFGYFDSHPHHHQHQHHTRLSPGGASSSSYEDRKRREDAHRRRRIEAERSRRRRGKGLFLSTSHSSPSLFDAEYDYPPQSQSQPNLRSEEEVDDNNDARQLRQRGTVLQSWPQLDDNEGNSERRCLELVVSAQRRNDGDRSYINSTEGEEDQLNEGNDMTFSFSDSPPSFIYANISMSQDEMMDNNNIGKTTASTTTTPTRTTTSTTTTSSRTSAPRKTGSMDSFFFTHMDKYEKLNKYYSMKDMVRKKEDQGVVEPRADTIEVDNEEEDAVSCPPHIIAEEEDEDASDDDEIDANDISFWRGSSTERNRQRASFRS
jgi:hypothetical protein